MSTNQQPVVRKSVPTIDTGMIKVARKPRGWRRVARTLGKLGAGLLGVIVLVLIFLHTPWGKSFVKGRIEAKLGAMVNGSASLGELDYGFMFGSLELGKLEIRDASDKPAIKIDRIALDIDRGALLGGSLKMDELSITGVDVSVVKHADGTSNLTGRVWLSLDDDWVQSTAPASLAGPHRCITPRRCIRQGACRRR